MMKKLKGFTLLELIIVMAIFSIIMYSAVQLLAPVSKFFVRSSNFENTTACMDNMRRCIEGNLKYADRVRAYNSFVPYTYNDATYQSITPTNDLLDNVKDFYIEFVGDSLTAAYGNIGKPGASDPGSALWQDGTQSYAFLACEELDVDYSIAACSGVGIDKGWTQFSVKGFYAKESFYRGLTSTFFNPRTPDIVVINLGTNDYDCGSSESGFKTKMKELIEYVRESYVEDVTIIWAYNFGGYGCDDWAFDVIEELGGEDNGIYLLKMTREQSGANGHPNLEGHYTAADELVTFIKNKDLLD